MAFNFIMLVWWFSLLSSEGLRCNVVPKSLSLIIREIMWIKWKVKQHVSISRCARDHCRPRQLCVCRAGWESVIRRKSVTSTKQVAPSSVLNEIGDKLGFYCIFISFSFAIKFQIHLITSLIIKRRSSRLIFRHIMEVSCGRRQSFVIIKNR